MCCAKRLTAAEHHQHSAAEPHVFMNKTSVFDPGLGSIKANVITLQCEDEHVKK